jgi:hypothetical protein
MMSVSVGQNFKVRQETMAYNVKVRFLTYIV